MPRRACPWCGRLAAAATLLLPAALLPASLLPAVARADNPFAAPGEAGVGEGWRGLPEGLVGSAIRLEDQALRLQARGADGPRVRACQAEGTPVQGRLRVHGAWRVEGVDGAEGNAGARVRLKYLDAAGNGLASQDGVDIVRTARGTRDWQRIDTVVDPPAGAHAALMCVDLHNATTGTAWFRDLELAAPAAEGKNVVWIVLDTLRADVLSAYGARTAPNPAIDRLAAGGVIFERAWAQYTWTNPSTVSAFASQYARTHGWEYAMGKSHLDDVHQMSGRLTTLAEVLRDQGFITQGYYANGYLRGDIGFDRGFHTWAYGRDETVVARAIEDIGRWKQDGAPNFLYVHLMTMHVPLRPSAAAQAAAGVKLSVPADGLGYFEQGAAAADEATHNALFAQAYRASVFDADAYVGQVLAALDREGLATDTLVVLSSDHGELLGEHGEVGHGNFVYEPLTAVPLIVKGPGIKPRREQQRVGQVIDIAPTVLDWLGLERARPASWQGLSLLDPAPGRTAVSERNQLLAVTTDGRWKAIEANASGKLQEAYDLSADPLESQDLAGQGGAGVTAAQAAARAWRAATPDLDNDGARLVLEQEDKDETMELLQQLGYVE